MDRPCTRLILAAIATVALGSDLDAEELGFRVEVAAARSDIDSTSVHETRASWVESEDATGLTNVSVTFPVGSVAGYLAWESEPELVIAGETSSHGSFGSVRTSNDFEALEAGVSFAYSYRKLTLCPRLALAHLRLAAETNRLRYDLIVRPSVDEVVSVEQELWGVAAGVRADQRLVGRFGLAGAVMVRWGTGTADTHSEGTYAEIDPDLGVVVYRDRSAAESDDESLAMFGVDLAAWVELGRSVSVEAGWRLRDWGDNGRIEGPFLGAVVRF